MKKAISLLLAGTMCIALAGCGQQWNEDPKTPEGPAPSVTVTEDTDPLTLVGEKAERAAWEAAFSEASNFGVKTVITMTSTENGTTMSQKVSMVYRFTEDGAAFTMAVEEGSEEQFSGEGYFEIEGETVSLWQRSEENGAWSAWDGEQFVKESIPVIFAMKGGLGFVRTRYADFSFSDAEKGYAATASGLTQIGPSAASFAAALLSGSIDDGATVNVTKLVVKLCQGKPGACILTAAIEDPLPEEDGQAAEPAETPAERTIVITQVYFDYGKVHLTRPEDLPALGAEEEGE